MTRLKPFFRKLMLALFMLLLGLGVFLGTCGNLAHKSYAAALLVSVLLLAVGYCRRNRLGIFLEKLNRMDPVKLAAVLTITYLLLNGLWVLCFQPKQAPDFQTFFNAAADLAKGIHPQGRDYIAMFPHILGYSAFLSLFLKIFGQTVMTASVLNVILTAVSGILIYSICCMWLDTASAAAAFALWIICPSKLLYNSMSFSEPYYTCLLLLFFMLVSVVERAKQKKLVVSALTGASAGIVLGLVNTARPIGIIPIIALAIWLLFLINGDERRNEWKKWSLFFLLLLSTYGLTSMLWNTFETEQLEQNPASIPGYSIYVGFNAETQGSYSDSDMELLQSRYFGEYGRNADAAQNSMLEDAKIRIREEAGSIPVLMMHKLSTLLGHDEGGVFYSKDGLSEKAYSLLCVASNLWYYFICILAIFGCVKLWRSGTGGSILLIPLFSLGLVLAQLLVEVAARYHYALVPMLIILSAFCINNLIDRSVTRGRL